MFFHVLLQILQLLERANRIEGCLIFLFLRKNFFFSRLFCRFLTLHIRRLIRNRCVVARFRSSFLLGLLFCQCLFSLRTFRSIFFCLLASTFLRFFGSGFCFGSPAFLFLGFSLTVCLHLLFKLNQTSVLSHSLGHIKRSHVYVLRIQLILAIQCVNGRQVTLYSLNLFLDFGCCLTFLEAHIQILCLKHSLKRKYLCQFSDCLSIYILQSGFLLLFYAVLIFLYLPVNDADLLLDEYRYILQVILEYLIRLHALFLDKLSSVLDLIEQFSKGGSVILRIRYRIFRIHQALVCFHDTSDIRLQLRFVPVNLLQESVFRWIHESYFHFFIHCEFPPILPSTNL